MQETEIIESGKFTFLDALANGKQLALLKEYDAFDVPEGTWRGVLDFTMDHPRIGVYCYFTATDSKLEGAKFRLTALARNDFKPLNPKAPNMLEAIPGTEFELESSRDPKIIFGVWINAEIL